MTEVPPGVPLPAADSDADAPTPIPTGTGTGTSPATGTGTSPGSPGGPVRGVHILVPRTWYEFDIHPATRDDSIRAAVRDRVKERPELAGHEAELVRTLRKLSREAWANGVLYCGSMAEVHEDAPLIANITIAVMDARDDHGKILPTEPTTILSSLKPIPQGKRPTDPWRRSGMVHLPDAGPAARSAGIEDIEMPGDSRIARMVMMQTFVPLPDGDPRVAVITGATPQLELAEPMLALFDGITSTFRFVRAERGGASGAGTRAAQEGSSHGTPHRLAHPGSGPGPHPGGAP